jgi:exopolyphosphatase / guanosine-5'-triphosphate,3'-diphosphate pyrophosphatase
MGSNFAPPKMENRIAIIDMGTNTFHLLIAEKRNGGYQIIHRERNASKIGVGGINDGFITAEGIDRAMTALKNFQQVLLDWNVIKATAFGTSALRNAKNGKEIVEKIRTETGIETLIISGEEEADYIYRGVRSAVDLGMEKSLIVDIGGGSVEFIIGNATEIFWKQSFEIGGQRLLERFHHHDPILKEEVERIQQFLEVELKPLITQLEIHRPLLLVGSSGTFDTLSEIYCRGQNIPYSDDPETPLTLQAFSDIFNLLLNKNREQRMQVPGMIEMRVDMIVVVCCLIEFLLHKHSFKNIRVSTYSLKEGVLASLTIT